MDPITQAFKAHHAEKFASLGATAEGIGWKNQETLDLRYEKMLAVIEPELLQRNEPISVLDVGCGYGGLYDYAQEQGINLKYVGIDVCEDMIAHARGLYPDCDFECVDVFGFEPDQTFDYVVCNGILTQKLHASQREMDQYAHRLIERMFDLCSKGVAFNTLTTKVDYMDPHLYYRNPVELFAFCVAHITEQVRLDHASPLFDYFVYLYHDQG